MIDERMCERCNCRFELTDSRKCPKCGSNHYCKVANCRKKILRVERQTVMACLLKGTKIRDELRLQIPEDVEVISAGDDFMSNCIVFCLRHDSFEVVPLGQMPPVVNEEAWRNPILVGNR